MTSVSSSSSLSKKETTIIQTIESTVNQLISSSSSSSPIISASSSVSSASLPPSETGGGPVNLDDIFIKNKLIQLDDNEESDEYETDRLLPTNLGNNDFKKPSQLNTNNDSICKSLNKSDATSVRVAVR